ncbi:MAG: hypothetical protein ACE5K0_06180 [Candidatus Methanofastidiosia archaeon]
MKSSKHKKRERVEKFFIKYEKVIFSIILIVFLTSFTSFYIYPRFHSRLISTHTSLIFDISDIEQLTYSEPLFYQWPPQEYEHIFINPAFDPSSNEPEMWGNIFYSIGLIHLKCYSNKNQYAVTGAEFQCTFHENVFEDIVFLGYLIIDESSSSPPIIYHETFNKEQAKKFLRKLDESQSRTEIDDYFTWKGYHGKLYEKSIIIGEPGTHIIKVFLFFDKIENYHDDWKVIDGQIIFIEGGSENVYPKYLAYFEFQYKSISEDEYKEFVIKFFANVVAIGLVGVWALSGIWLNLRKIYFGR